MPIELCYDFKLSLKDSAMRRIAVDLWNDPYLLNSITRFVSLRSLYHENQEMPPNSIESAVKTKLDSLGLPKPLLKQLLPILTPVGLQIRTWKEFHKDYIHDPLEEFNAPILSRLCWSEAGSVDYQKTAEELIRYNLLDTENSYKIACLYCLDDYIHVLWEKLPVETQKKYYCEEAISKSENVRLEFYWPYILSKKAYKLTNMFFEKYEVLLELNQYLFMYSVACGNKAASDYFYQKLTHSEKNFSFHCRIFQIALSNLYSGSYKYAIENFPLIKMSEVVLYLLSKMDLHTQTFLIRSHSEKVLACFLDWPFQEIFMKNASLLFPFTPACGSPSLWNYMHQRFRTSKNYFPSIFQEFFIKCPKSVRKTFVIRECRFGEFLPKFLAILDMETIEVILKNIEPGDRLRLVTSNPFLKLINDLILKEKWHMLEMCIREGVLTKQHSDILKKVFGEFLRRNDNGLVSLRKQQHIKFLQLLEKITASILSKEV